MTDKELLISVLKELSRDIEISIEDVVRHTDEVYDVDFHKGEKYGLEIAQAIINRYINHYESVSK